MIEAKCDARLVLQLLGSRHQTGPGATHQQGDAGMHPENLQDLGRTLKVVRRHEDEPEGELRPP